MLPRAAGLSALLLLPVMIGAASPRAAASSPAVVTPSTQITVHITPQGSVTDLAVDPRSSTTVYAGTDSAGVFRSDSGGATWVSAKSNLPNNLAIHGLLVDPAHHTTVYVATDQGVFQSNNRGGSWASEGPPTSSASTSIALDPTNSATLYAGTAGDGIYRSANQGDTWSAIGPRRSQINVVAVDPVSGATIYAGTDDGLLISHGHGIWQRAGLGHVNVQAVAISAANTRVIYVGYAKGVLRSRDGGVSWTRVGLTTRSISMVYADVANPARAYAASAADGGLFLTTNYGHSWLPLVAGLSSDRVVSFAVDPSDTRVTYAGLNPGVFKSLQSGSSWASSSIYDRSVRAILQPRTTAGAFYAGTNSGVYISHDGGEIWTSNGLGNHTVSALLPITGGLLAATESGIYRTTDGGHIWPRATRVPANALLPDPATAGAFYAGTRDGLFHSADGGVTWTQLSASTDPIYALYARSDGAIIAGGDSGVQISIDDGLSFQRVPVGGGQVVQFLARAQPNAIYEALYARTRDGAVYFSADGGKSWSNREVGGAVTTALTLGDNGILYAGTNHGIYRSSSGGLSWILTDQQDQLLSPLVLQPALNGSAGTLLEGLDGQGILVHTLTVTPASPFAPLPGNAGGQFFTSTGHYVRAPFLDWYLSHHGPTVFGAPLTEQRKENGQLVQYYENALLIYMPEMANTPRVIQLAPLGSQYKDVSSPSVPPFDNTTRKWYFPQTGHSLTGEFRQFWRDFGGIDVFGYPISEQVTENGQVVQYFQNVRLEADPSAGPGVYHTKVTPLGHQLGKDKGWLQ